MTRREFLKGTAGFVILCGLGFGMPELSQALTQETVVGPLLKDGLRLVPTGDGAEIRFHGETCFTVNAAGAQLLKLADGSYTLQDMTTLAGLSGQEEAVADFFITLGQAGYLQNRVEVNKIAVCM